MIDEEQDDYTNEGMGLDAFLGHKSSSGSGKGGRLKKWKKNDPPTVDTWMHTKSKIAALWQHGQPHVVEYKDRDTNEKVQKVFGGGQFTCWEREELLQEQYKRDDETGRRKRPPTICPECLLVEYFRDQVESGELPWTKPVFRYEAKDDERPTIVRAAGLYGGFKKKQYTEQEIKQLKDAHVNRRESWRENQMAKLNYVFSVVDNSNPSQGTMIAVETFLLGDKVKEVIQKAMLEDDEKGNPFLHPYCIRWLHRPDEDDIKKKYDAIKLGKITMSEEVRKLIRETDPPDLKHTLSRGNPVKLRAQLEEACLIKGVPWDAIFGRAEKAWEAKEAKEGTNFDVDEYEKADAEKITDVRSKAEDWVCEECGELVKAGAKKCPSCGSTAKPPADIDDKLGGDDLPY